MNNSCGTQIIENIDAARQQTQVMTLLISYHSLGLFFLFNIKKTNA